MRRGDLVTVALQGDQGKPRPALVVQSDHFTDLGAITVLPITGTLVNGLPKRSQIMVEKPQTPPRSRSGMVIGHLDDPTMVTVNRVLAVFLGLV